MLSHSQKNFTNKYKYYNNDSTLRLDYIEHRDKETVLYILYRGAASKGFFSGLYLNDYKLVVHSTGEIFRPTSSTVPSQPDSYFFLQNANTGIQLQIRFPRIPAYVKIFDLVEPTTDQYPTFNFTFRNLKVDESQDLTWELAGWQMEARTPRFIQVFTNSQMELDVYINEIFVGTNTKSFPGKTQPECGQYGTLRIAFGDQEKKNIRVVGRTGSKTYTWNWHLAPLLYCQTIGVNL